jgi:molybdate transport system substrate-binding protein
MKLFCAMRIVRRLLNFCFLLAVLLWACHAPAQTTLHVSAADSLKDSLLEIEAAYQKGRAHFDFSNNFGSSGTLAMQIDQGAPVDIFLSAATKPMDDLDSKGLIISGTRRNLLRNTLVLVAPFDSTLKNFSELANNSVRVIAIGNPASVPAGQYGEQTLRAMHLWDKLNSKFVLANDVRQVLVYVETGNADAGLVYATDARISAKVRVVDTAPDSAHDPIIYPAAVVKGSNSEAEAEKFVEYLNGATARAIFVKYGFTIAAP